MSKLTVSNLTKVVKNKTLLNNVCLSLNYGQVYSVIGLSQPIGTVALDDKVVNSFNL